MTTLRLCMRVWNQFRCKLTATAILPSTCSGIFLYTSRDPPARDKSYIQITFKLQWGLIQHNIWIIFIVTRFNNELAFLNVTRSPLCTNQNIKYWNISSVYKLKHTSTEMLKSSSKPPIGPFLWSSPLPKWSTGNHYKNNFYEVQRI